jgi:hypothetical protein
MRKLYMRNVAVLCVLLVTSSCSLAADETSKAPAAEQDSDRVGGNVKKVSAPITRSLKADFAQNFTNVIMQNGKPLVVPDLSGAETSFGMSCAPNLVSDEKRNFKIVLPTDKAERSHPLAVITPGGRIYELYTPYGPDVESEDISAPSLAISWQKAATENEFNLSIEELSGIEVGKDEPFAIFVEEGVYQFALVNSIQRDLIKANATKPEVSVFAGCAMQFKN